MKIQFSAEGWEQYVSWQAQDKKHEPLIQYGGHGFGLGQIHLLGGFTRCIRITTSLKEKDMPNCYSLFQSLEKDDGGTLSPEEAQKRVTDILQSQIVAYEELILSTKEELSFILGGGLQDSSKAALYFRLRACVAEFVDDYALDVADITSMVNHQYGGVGFQFAEKTVAAALGEFCDSGILCRGILVANEVVPASLEQHNLNPRPMYCVPEYFNT